MDDQRLFPASLECLHLTGCTVEDTVLRDSLRGCTVLGSLKLSQIDSFTEIPSETMRSLVRLRDLYIGGCKQLVRLEGLNHLDSLEHLTIIKCPSLMDLKVAGKAHAVPRLTVDDMSLVPKLLSRGAYPSLKWLALEHSVELRGEWILEHLTSLAYLGFTSCHWNSFPTTWRTSPHLRSYILISVEVSGPFQNYLNLCCTSDPLAANSFSWDQIGTI